MIATQVEVREQRGASRHPIGRFVAPGTQAGAMEGFLVVELSRSGMSLLRVPRDGADDSEPRGLDHRFSWLAVPLPERAVHVCVLAEVLRRERFGPLERLGLRFEQMGARDRLMLDTYLAERESLSFGASRVPIWQWG